jgi:hypothetical protein
MSYTNPKQYLDTQSGQYIREMQQSVAKSFGQYASKVAEEYKKRDLENKKIKKEADVRTNAARNAIYQAKSKNSSIDFESLNSELDKMNQILRYDPATLTPKQRSFLTGMENMGSTIRNVLENTSAFQQEFLEAEEKNQLGGRGGIDRYTNPEQYKALRVLYGLDPGSKKADFTTNENGETVFSVKIYNEDGKEISSVINDSMSTVMRPNIVPDPSKEEAEGLTAAVKSMQLNKASSDALIGGKKVLLPDGSIGIKYNDEVIKKSVIPVANNIINGMEIGDAITFYNNTLNTEGDKGVFENSTMPNDEIRAEISKKYSEYLVKDARIQSVLGGSFVYKPKTEATAEDFSGIIQNWDKAINLKTEESLSLFDGQTILIDGASRTINSVEVFKNGTVEVEYNSSDTKEGSKTQDFNKLNFYRSIADTMTGDEKKTINQQINRIIASDGKKGSSTSGINRIIASDGKKGSSTSGESKNNDGNVEGVKIGFLN